MSYCVSEGAVCTGGPGGGGAGGGIVPRGFTRQLVAKTLLPASVGQTPPQWVYDRPQGTTLTNPPKITATDPFGNDTVYWFHASAPGGGVSTGAGTEDGFAPEWNDGTTYRIDYYEGDSTTGRLVRSVLQDYDADRDPLNSSKHLKVNVRVKRTTTSTSTTQADRSSCRVTTGTSSGTGRPRHSRASKSRAP